MQASNTSSSSSSLLLKAASMRSPALPPPHPLATAAFEQAAAVAARKLTAMSFSTNRLINSDPRRTTLVKADTLLSEYVYLHVQKSDALGLATSILEESRVSNEPPSDDDQRKTLVFNEEANSTPTTPTTSGGERNSWERVFMTLATDQIISVFASQQQMTNPVRIINLVAYQLVDMSGTTFALTIIDKHQTPSPPPPPPPPQHETTSGEDASQTTKAAHTPSPNAQKLKSKMKMFEANYELKFKNKETK